MLKEDTPDPDELIEIESDLRQGASLTKVGAYLFLKCLMDIPIMF